MKENPDEKEHALSAFVDHPDIEFLTDSVRFERYGGNSFGRHLQPLQPFPLCLISLQMGRVYSAIWQVRMLIY